MTGLDIFRTSLLKLLIPRAKEILARHHQHIDDSITADLLGVGEDELKGVTNPKPDEVFLNALRRHFTEVTDSSENLENIVTYLRRYSPSQTLVGPAPFTRYHVENYFHELYILKQRLTTLFKWVKRSYRKATVRETIDELTDALDSLITQAFQGVVLTRGSHVHVERFDDASLRRLSTLALLASDGDHKFKQLYREAQVEIRREKIKWMRKNNAEIKKLLDTVFDVLHQIVFMPGGDLRTPSAARRI